MENSSLPPSVSGPSAPPPPPEVKVRTMRSDLDAMAKSGGGLPRFENVSVAGLSMGKEVPEDSAETKNKDSANVILVVVAVLALIGLAGYFVYTIFLKNGSGAPQATTQNRPVVGSGTSSGNGTQAPAANPAAQESTPIVPAVFTHISLFKKPADQTLAITLSSGGAASSAADLQTFNQKISGLIKNRTSTFMEIAIKSADGRDLGIGEILSQANAEVINTQTLAAHFNPDATFFVYRDKNGFWPGYVISLKQGENWLFSGSDVKNLESSPSITNLFLDNMGKPSADGFTDSTISGIAVRVLPFLDTGIPAYFTYGWVRTDLILSTSQGGFAQALSRL